MTHAPPPPPDDEGGITMHGCTDRMLVVLWIVLVLGLIAIGVSAFVLMTSTPAAAATCASRPGVSHGATWWRYRYRNGVRCWYPGPRYAKRKRGDASAKYRQDKTAKPETLPAQQAALTVRAEPRTVRIIQIYNGRTVHERIDRAFDKLITFPIEDEP